MLLANKNELEMYENILKQELSPIAGAIDEEGYYPECVMRQLGKVGAFQVSNLTKQESMSKRLKLVEMSAEYCVSTSFLIWCHTTSISFITNSHNSYLKERLLPLMESGEVLGGTALSNPMKYYASMEDVRLKAKVVEGGYIINGIIPYVSNVGPGHWFGAIAEVNKEQRILAMIDCNSLNITMKEHKNFTGLNGTSSYTCRFKDVFIPNECIISDSADQFIPMIRSSFVLSQVGMGLGLIRACADNMLKVVNKQNDTNQFIGTTPSEIIEQLHTLQHNAYQLTEDSSEKDFISTVQIRLESAELALKTAETAILYQGAAGYYRQSECMRRLREALFIAIVTPAIKHLKRIIYEHNQATS